MSRLMLIAAAVLIGSAALAQTKDQCGTVASVLVQDFPQRQKAATFNMDEVFAKLKEANRPVAACD
jgi:hypothetical protein